MARQLAGMNGIAATATRIGRAAVYAVISRCARSAAVCGAAVGAVTSARSMLLTWALMASNDSALRSS